MLTNVHNPADGSRPSDHNRRSANFTADEAPIKQHVRYPYLGGIKEDEGNWRDQARLGCASNDWQSSGSRGLLK